VESVIVDNVRHSDMLGHVFPAHYRLDYYTTKYPITNDNQSQLIELNKTAENANETVTNSTHSIEIDINDMNNDTNIVTDIDFNYNDFNEHDSLVLSSNVASNVKHEDNCATFNPCLNGAQCENVKDENESVIYSIGSKVLNGKSCICKPGYEGLRCEKLRYIIGCPPMNPCLNNGVCYSKVLGFQCACRSGFYGDRCEMRRGVSSSILVRFFLLIN
jgi:hypothetical protein